MYEFECLTDETKIAESEICSPFLGMCYPEAEGCCGPECSPEEVFSEDFESDEEE